MLHTRGDIWVSAVLYMALGVIVIALLLAASLPLIEKVKDRTTVSETKALLLAMDETIKVVAKEGPGSQRELSPLTITEGQLFIDGAAESIRWEMKTGAVILEPGVRLQEGVLTLLLQPTPVKDEYLMTITMWYNGTLDLNLVSDYQSPFQGHYSALVQHSGQYTTLADGRDVPVVTFKVL